MKCCLCAFSSTWHPPPFLIPSLSYVPAATMPPTLLSCAAYRRLGALHPLVKQAVLQRMALRQMTQQAKEGEAQTVPAPALKQVSNWEHDQQGAEHQMCFA